LIGGVPNGSCPEGVGDPLVRAVRNCQEERLLGAEEAHDVRLRHACTLGDAVGGRTLEPTAAELDRGRCGDLCATLVGGMPCGFFVHSLTWYQSITTIRSKGSNQPITRSGNGRLARTR